MLSVVVRVHCASTSQFLRKYREERTNILKHSERKCSEESVRTTSAGIGGARRSAPNCTHNLISPRSPASRKKRTNLEHSLYRLLIRPGSSSRPHLKTDTAQTPNIRLGRITLFPILHYFRRHPEDRSLHRHVRVVIVDIIYRRLVSDWGEKEGGRGRTGFFGGTEI